MNLYQDPQGNLGVQVPATYDVATLFLTGKRTLIHLPAEYVDALCEAHRPLQAGDAIGLHSNPVRVVMTTITKVERIHLHDVTEDDLVLLGRSRDDMDVYRKSWDQIWNNPDKYLDGECWPWDENPEVYAIAWKPLNMKQGLV